MVCWLADTGTTGLAMQAQTQYVEASALWQNYNQFHYRKFSIQDHFGRWLSLCIFQGISLWSPDFYFQEKSDHWYWSNCPCIKTSSAHKSGTFRSKVSDIDWMTQLFLFKWDISLCISNFDWDRWHGLLQIFAYFEKWAKTGFCRLNRLGPEGWSKLLDILPLCSNLKSLNDFSSYASLLAGGCEELDISGREMGAVAELLIRKNMITLKRIDLRYLKQIVCWHVAVRIPLPHSFNAPRLSTLAEKQFGA
jgi:hypothetical protein